VVGETLSLISLTSFLIGVIFGILISIVYVKYGKIPYSPVPKLFAILFVIIIIDGITGKDYVKVLIGITALFLLYPPLRKANPTNNVEENKG